MSAAKGFWTTLPGILTAAAGLVAAVSGLLAGMHNLGWISAGKETGADKAIHADKRIGTDKEIGAGKESASSASAPAASGAQPVRQAATPSATQAATGLSGAWDAEVAYDWGAKHRERIVIEVLSDGGVRGSASFLGVPRGIVSGRAGAGGVEFVTETEEMLGSETRTTRHTYQVTSSGQGLDIVMQTSGASQPHPPIRFSAQRALQ